jgi:excisionase family DNA binding protein
MRAELLGMARKVEKPKRGAMKTLRKAPAKVPAIGDRLLTLSEAAEILRLSTRTVREYVGRGEIEGRIIGGRWRFRRADLDAFFENASREWDFRGKDADRD